jgi:sugar/nucleoside kinase (ribokinase family)
MDLAEFPILGHSVQAQSLRPEAGGKGLNIAAGFARLGLSAHLIARVGGDELGRALLAVLDREGVKTDHVIVDEDGNSGIVIALIDTTTSAEAHIIAHPQASRVPEEHLERNVNAFDGMDAFVITPGISAQSATRATVLARRHNPDALIVFQFRPHEFLSNDQIAALSENIDLVMGTVTNLWYLLSLSGDEHDSTDALRIAQRLRVVYGFRAVCITDGITGGAYVDESEALRFLPFPVDDHPLDRTGAIDAFCVGFVTMHLEQRNVRQSLRFATAAGRLAIQAAGGYPAMPLRNSVERFLTMPRNQAFDLFSLSEDGV